MSVPKSKRKQHQFMLTNNAYDIYDELLKLIDDMPDKYVDIVLKTAISYAGMAADCLRSAYDTKQKSDERMHLLHARRIYQRLSGRLNFFLFRPNVISYKSTKTDRIVSIPEGTLKNIGVKIHTVLTDINNQISKL